jgi:hypothetical protein
MRWNTSTFFGLGQYFEPNSYALCLMLRISTVFVMGQVPYICMPPDHNSPNDFSIVLSKISAWLSPKMSIGRSLTAVSPHAPICTPFLRIVEQNRSLVGASWKFQAMNVPRPLPRKSLTISPRLSNMLSKDEYSLSPILAVLATRSSRWMMSINLLAWRVRMGSP